MLWRRLSLNIQPPMPSILAQDRPAHILIVDDEPINRALLKRLLEKDYEITEAGDGFKALELIREGDFDLILLDIMMPRMNGLDMLAELREDYPSTELPVILVSALRDSSNIVSGLEAGANDYIPKPIDSGVVKARVFTQLQVKYAFDVQRRAFQESQQANALKNKLLSIASHDLKSPLSSVFMAESLLRQLTDPNDPTAVNVLDTMKQTLTMMNSIISEFLDMAALQSGEIVIDLQPVDIEDVLLEVLTYYEIALQDKGSVITALNIEGYVMADRTRLQQVLNNLVSNALKYSPPNAEITIDVIMVGEDIVIEITDEGPGIPEDEHHLLFMEFSKLSPRPTGDESSSGLGLWIVKQMVDLMKGEVGVYCPETGGSVFWVKLPRA